MKVLVLSDLHLEFAPLLLPQDVEFDVAILAGDICCPGSRGVAWAQRESTLQRAQAIVAVAGNHEYYDCVMQDEMAAMRGMAEPAAQPRIHLLDCERVVVAGVRFLGCTLWTDFGLHIDGDHGPVSDPNQGMAAARKAMVDYRVIQVADDKPDSSVTRMLTPEDTLALHRAHRAWLERALDEPFDGPTVVVTHHGPHRGSLVPRFAAAWVSTAYMSELPGKFFEVPVLWVHGHTHTSFDYRVGGCRVLCNPRGYQIGSSALPENRRFNPGLVVEIV